MDPTPFHFHAKAEKPELCKRLEHEPEKEKPLFRKIIVNSNLEHDRDAL
jgi:hypothetical protein